MVVYKIQLVTGIIEELNIIDSKKVFVIYAKLKSDSGKPINIRRSHWVNPTIGARRKPKLGDTAYVHLTNNYFKGAFEAYSFSIKKPAAKSLLVTKYYGTKQAQYHTWIYITVVILLFAVKYTFKSMNIEANLPDHPLFIYACARFLVLFLFF